MRTRIFTLAIAGLLGLSVSAAANAASSPAVGRFQLSSGDVQIITPDKKSRPGSRGELVNEGDTVVTGKTGAAHIRMSDDGIIAMRADTTIVIDTFRWEGREDGTERSVLSLVKGGFRAITGVIGRTNKSQYIVNTTTATIGIRGTDHEPFFIPAPAAGETPSAEPGTYNKVNIGETFIRTSAGTVELGQNQVGFASVQGNVAPVRLERMPEFMRATAMPRGKPDMRGVREFASRAERRAEAVRGLQERNISPQQFRQALLFRIRTAGEDFDLAGQSGGFRFAPRDTALTGSLLYFTGGNVRFDIAGVVAGNGRDSILLDSSNNPRIVSDQSSDFRYSREGAPLIDRGATIVDGEGVKWGVYAGGLRFDQRGVSQALLFTFMLAAQATPLSVLTQPGVAVFNTTAGFTAPVDENRNVGGMARLDATVVFGANPRITNYDLRVTDGRARLWNANLNTPSQSLASFARNPTSPNLAVTCAGAACGAPAGQGQASGFVIGPNRGGLISSYGLSAGNSAVTGSIVVKP